MAEYVFTFCDRCSPDGAVGQKVRTGDGRGWADGGAEYALAHLGWERRPEGIVCPECLDEEEAKDGD